MVTLVCNLGFRIVIDTGSSLLILTDFYKMRI
jgi:hypothetical protein